MHMLVFRGQAKSDIINGTNFFPVPATVYVERVYPTTECGVPLLVYYRSYDCPCCYWDSDPVIVYKVKSVSWQAVSVAAPVADAST